MPRSNDTECCCATDGGNALENVIQVLRERFLKRHQRDKGCKKYVSWICLKPLTMSMITN